MEIVPVAELHGAASWRLHAHAVQAAAGFVPNQPGRQAWQAPPCVAQSACLRPPQLLAQQKPLACSELAPEQLWHEVALVHVAQAAGHCVQGPPAGPNQPLTQRHWLTEVEPMLLCELAGHEAHVRPSRETYLLAPHWVQTPTVGLP